MIFIFHKFLNGQTVNQMLMCMAEGVLRFYYCNFNGIMLCRRRDPITYEKNKDNLYM